MKLNRNITYKIYCPDNLEEVRDKLLELDSSISKMVFEYCIDECGEGFVIYPNDYVGSSIFWVKSGKFYDGHIEEQWPESELLTVEDLLGPTKFVKHKINKHFVV